ncbi:hypothetical protein BC831DRAFT_274838 [Entophlyctis helioformis]|nr:hypothetical protein BC831DRAFT_274838 [Entophlyctis helioformis]
MSSRSCKGYMVDCKNPAVKGRLFCFTCAGRKSRNKKTLALESFEKECEVLRIRVSELEPQVEHWKRLAASLRLSEIEAKNELLRVKSIYSGGRETAACADDKSVHELSGAAEALLAIADCTHIAAHQHVHVSTPVHHEPAATIFSEIAPPTPMTPMPCQSAEPNASSYGSLAAVMMDSHHTHNSCHPHDYQHVQHVVATTAYPPCATPTTGASDTCKSASYPSFGPHHAMYNQQHTPVPMRVHAIMMHDTLPQFAPAAEHSHEHSHDHPHDHPTHHAVHSLSKPPMPNLPSLSVQLPPFSHIAKRSLRTQSPSHHQPRHRRQPHQHHAAGHDNNTDNGDTDAARVSLKRRSLSPISSPSDHGESSPASSSSSSPSSHSPLAGRSFHKRQASKRLRVAYDDEDYTE